MNLDHELKKIVDLFRGEMQDNLIGVYLHGSLAMGCFNPSKSDIDVLVISKDALTTTLKKRIAKRILLLQSKLANKCGLEVSIIKETYLKELVHPTPFEFHYSEAHKEKYETDDNYTCGGFEDPDLAAHIFVTYHRGKVLYGKPIREVFQPIDRKFFVESILYDLEDAPKGIIHSPVYFVLNLCRALYFLKEGVVASKREGGQWGVTVLPYQYRGLIQKCLDEYGGDGAKVEWDEQELLDFCYYMLRDIRGVEGAS